MYTGYNLAMNTDKSRITTLSEGPLDLNGQVVVYWMQADQRPTDNWALIRSVELADELHVPVIVLFILHTRTRNSYLRHYDFMLRGLAETARELRSAGFGFGLVMAHDPAAEIARLSVELAAAAVVTDQSYLRWGKWIRREAASKIMVQFEGVDAHTIVPPPDAYPKAAYGAYILRPKLRRLRERYLTEFDETGPSVEWQGVITGALPDQDVSLLLSRLNLDSSVGPVELPAGPQAASMRLASFIEGGFGVYARKRNDPVAQATSGLSPYLHFGQIASQRVALDVVNSAAYDHVQDAAEGFLDELITWRELAVNHVMYNPNYGKYTALPAWARKSLALHTDDSREYLYSRSELELAQTHDQLWNAGQTEMTKTGRMHGYLRMYWAKKILEWSPSANAAIEVAIYLNDKYFLDGRDANGYSGILWAIGGLHDRPWFDRSVYGQVRYMSYGGAKSKFDIQAYIDWVDHL